MACLLPWLVVERVFTAQSKLSEREEKLKNITASIRKREEARKEPGQAADCHVTVM